jgi:DNA topoisomerase-1
VVDAVRSLPFVVTKVEKRRRNKRPGAPFTTSTIQQEAAKKLGFSSRRTMRAAQDLYEGIELGNEGAVGLITYMRTDSVRVAETAVASARELIQRQYGKRYLPEAPNVYSDRKNARVQGAHEAIRPTDVRRRPDEVQKYLEPDQFRLYQLIWQRFLASQMTPAQYDMTVVEFDLGKYLFRATGSVMVFDGYHVLYTEGREKEEGRQVEDLPPIPPLSQGDTVEVREITPSQHFTEPPPRFSEASLVKELERLGIGRPSTYSAIISTLSAREYVKVDQRRFFPTELGETVEKIMIGKFPEIFNVEFTSGMETELDRVEEGELGWQRVLHDFYGPFNKALGAVDMNALVSDAYGLSAEDIAKEKCPKCGSQVELRTGRFGPYLACVKYKDTCDYVKSLKKARTPDRPTDEKCHLCGSPMVIKTGRFGEFLACTTYPACKGTRAIPMGIKCPKCDVGDLAERRTKRGKSFWGCVRYPACDFSTWNKPVPDTCPECGFVGMEKKVSKAEGETRTCLKCKHKIVLAEPEEVALA